MPTAFAFLPMRDSSAEQMIARALDIRPMLRLAMSSAALVTLVALGTSPTLAQSPTGKSSGEIAATSKLLAERQEGCRLQAKQQKLSFLKRRSFVRDCMKKT
jgi:hypothetical protein